MEINMNSKLDELIQKCNIKWSDDNVDGRRHIKGTFTDEEKEEFINLYNKSRGIYSPVLSLPEIVIDD